jgi:glyoxylase-like metal-dependent hydrolase (beta-lactamase superfamily II)
MARTSFQACRLWRLPVMGHTIFIIKSENKTLAFTGDTTHHQILLTETPRTEFVYDTDPSVWKLNF